MEAAAYRGLLEEGLAALGLAADPRGVEAVLRHLELVRVWNERMNLTAITDPQEMVIKHALDAASGMAALGLEPGQRVLDVGTGAGFPGVVWKCLQPGIDLTLLESLQKRCRFLEEVGEAVVRPLSGGAGYQVVWGRAEDFGRKPEHREQYDVVTARAVAEMRVLVEYCLPFVRVGGRFLAMKGPSVGEEILAAEKAVAVLGGRVEEVRQLELPGGGGRRSLVLIRKERPTPKGYPRRPACRRRTRSEKRRCAGVRGRYAEIRSGACAGMPRPGKTAQQGCERARVSEQMFAGACVGRRRLLSAPGMGADLAVRVRCGRGSTSPLAKGKGVRREAESGGSRRQSHDPRNTNLIRGWAAWVSWLTTAKPEAAKGRMQ